MYTDIDTLKKSEVAEAARKRAALQRQRYKQQGFVMGGIPLPPETWAAIDRGVKAAGFKSRTAFLMWLVENHQEIFPALKDKPEESKRATVGKR